MVEYGATVSWERGGARFVDNRYSRAHRWEFDGGVRVNASSSPHVVPLPYSVEDAVDPEEAFVAALSSCHMLWFLALAAKEGYVVDAYDDAAEGNMEGDPDGGAWISEVTLRPVVRFSGAKAPDDAAVAALHHRAHELCFIARSVKTRIVEQGRWEHAA